MIIQLKRSGGFAGIPLNITCDTDQLEPEDRNSLQAMVESANFFSLPIKIQPSSPNVDRFIYRITVEKPDGCHSVEASDSGMPESLPQLIQRVTFLGRGTQKR